MGSDWGVTTADPLQQIEVAVRRVGPEHRDAPAFLPGQRLPLPVAVAAFTAGSAYVNHDDDAGRIEVGRRADLAVVDRNIFDAAAGLPGDARVTHTVAAGALVHGG
jgi:predicted amidohydrolase YtcJ